MNAYLTQQEWEVVQAKVEELEKLGVTANMLLQWFKHIGINKTDLRRSECA